MLRPLWCGSLDALSTLVRFRIPLGDRPDLQPLVLEGVEGLAEIAELMEKCWMTDLAQRPSFESE